MAEITVTADVEYVSGHLRYGHYEVTADSESFEKLNDEEKIEFIRTYGEFIVDDFRIDDRGPIIKDSIRISV